VPATQIDRLMIDAGEMSPAEGRSLILAVAAGLADAQVAAGRIPTLRISVERDDAGDIDQLARKIVADALRQIRRAP
jgi:hypothetical protein